MDRCRVDVPPLAPVGSDSGHLSACWLPHDKSGRERLRRKVLGPAQSERAEA
jgi:hypothetical protein